MSSNEAEKFQFLVKLALEKGAADAKIFPTDKVIVEDRVVLKCKVGCNHYGKTLACPPYTPSAEEFRKIVSNTATRCSWSSPPTHRLNQKCYPSSWLPETDPTVSREIKEKAAKFWQDWKDDKRKMLQCVVDLEKAAMNKGYSLAMSFVSGHCQLCEKCNTETRICRHPELGSLVRGRNWRKREENRRQRWHHSTFPFAKNPESFAILLID